MGAQDPNRNWTNLPNAGAAQLANLKVTEGIKGNGFPVLRTEGNPNGTLLGALGQLAYDFATSNMWQNTDGAQAWILWAGGGGGGTMQAFRISPMAPDPFGPGINMPTGIVNNYSDPSLPTYSLLWFKGADNEATRLSGIDATGLVDGDVRLFLNIPGLGLGSRDACAVVLLDESNPDAAGSADNNKFMCPGATNYTVPFWGHVWLIRGPADDAGGGSRWHVLGQNAWAQKSVIQSLNFYPNLQVSAPGAELAGNLNDWNPVGLSPYGVGPAFGINGSDLRFNDHTVLRCFCNVDNSATVTGMLVQPITDGPVAYGPVKVLVNEGPGTLTIAHLSGLSVIGNRIHCPDARNLVVPMGGAVWLMHMYPNLPDGQIQWRVLGLGNEVFPSVNTQTATTTRGLVIAPQRSTGALFGVPIVNSNVPLGANPGSVDVLADPNGSIMDGMEPSVLVVGATAGTMVQLRNTGAGPLILLDETVSASTAGNRFRLPNGSGAGAVGKPYVVPSRGSAWFRYDESSAWVLMSHGNLMTTLSTPLSITPAVLAAANVNNYAPTDAVTGLAGRYAYWWRIQGAVGTNLTGIDFQPAGLQAFSHGDRILLTNYASGMTVLHASGASAGANQIYCPGGVNIVLPNLGSIELIRDQPNAKWFVISKSL